MSSFPIIVLKLGDLGPEAIYHDLQDLIPVSERELFLLKIGAFYLSIVGQGHEKFLGLFGPLPVTGLPNWQSYVYSFQVSDSTLQDERLKHVAYCVLALLVPSSEIDELNYLRYHLEILFQKFFTRVKKISDINALTIKNLTQQIELLKQEFSVEWKEHRVVIERKVEKNILMSKKSKIKDLILDMKKKSLSLMVVAADDTFLRAMASSIIELVTNWSEQKGMLSLMDGRVSFVHYSFSRIKSASKTRKNVDGLILVTTKELLGSHVPILQQMLRDEHGLAIGILLDNDDTMSDMNASVDDQFKEISKKVMTELLPPQLFLSRPFIVCPLAFHESSLVEFLLVILEVLGG